MNKMQNVHLEKNKNSGFRPLLEMLAPLSYSSTRPVVFLSAYREKKQKKTDSQFSAGQMSFSDRRGLLHKQRGKGRGRRARWFPKVESLRELLRSKWLKWKWKKSGVIHRCIFLRGPSPSLIAVTLPEKQRLKVEKHVCRFTFSN